MGKCPTPAGNLELASSPIEHPDMLRFNKSYIYGTCFVTMFAVERVVTRALGKCPRRLSRADKQLEIFLT